MNIEKYIDLLRFYVTEKIDEVNLSLKKSIDDVIGNIISSIIASILALIISTDCIQLKGILGTILQVILLVCVYVILLFVFKWIRKRFITEKQLKDVNINQPSNLNHSCSIEG